MKRFIAITLSLAMVFALFGAMTVSVTAEDTTVTKILYSFEDDDGGTGPTIDGEKYQAVNHNVTWGRVTAQKHSGEKSLSTTPNTATWNQADNGNEQNVNSSNFLSYIEFPIPTKLKVTGNVGFWLYFGQSNSSNFSAYGVKMNGDYYFTKFKVYPVSWTNCILTGITLYKYNESATKITLTADDFASGTIESIVFVDGGTKDTSAPAYIDDIYYETSAASEITSSTIEMADGAAMRIDNATNGIRFDATVDKTAFDNLVGENATVTEIGTLIAKAGTDINDVVVDNAVDTGTGAKELADGEIPVAKYAEGTTMETVEKSDKYVIYGSLVGINEENNANQQYVARAYVKYTDTDGDHVLYASALSEPRSIAQVAKAIKEDTTILEDTGDTYYNSLCESHKSVVDTWAGKYDASKYSTEA
ncbi:MAG: hypothetical protein ACI396_03475 [Acutalibacteraceae bacterium]